MFKTAAISDVWQDIGEFFGGSGIAQFFTDGGWKNLIMLAVACVLIFLAVKKDFEPYLLIPIGFGMMLINFPGETGLTGDGGDAFISFLSAGLPVYPCLIFLCIGATTDFGPLIANKKTMLLGAAAQIGIFITFVGAIAIAKAIPSLEWNANVASSIGIIGGADGPTAILVTTRLADKYLPIIAVVAYSYMALVPVIQPPIIKALTTKEERKIRMDSVRPVTKQEKILFPIIVSFVTILIVPSCAPLIGCLMLGNLVKESGVVPNITKALANSLMYIVTIILGLCVGAKAKADLFISLDTLIIFGLGVIAFSIATASGVLFGKVMCKVTKGKINPMIGAAGVSAVPMAARVVHKIGQEEDPENFLLMHAMGPNVAGVIGSAVAAGVLLALF